MPKRISLDLEARIIQLAQTKNLYFTEIAREVGVSDATVDRILKRSGTKAKQKRIRPEVEAQIIQLYDGECKSAPQIGKQLGVGSTTVYRIRKRSGLRSRALQVAQRKNTLDHSCFSVLTEQSLYWAGYLMADGCVHKNQIVLGAKKADAEHLQRFLTFAWSNAAITPSMRNGYPQLQVRVYSDKIASDLAKLGVVPRKSLTAKAPKRIAARLEFWRGVFDGDGSLGIYADRRKSPPRRAARLNLVGSQFLLEQFRTFLARNGMKSKATVRSKKPHNHFTFDLEGCAAVHAVRLLYTDNSLHLPRKYAMAQKILAEFG
jgi:transposase-like protein